MPRIPQELKDQAENLFSQGFKVKEIASKLGVSISRANYCVYLAKIKQKGFERPIEERDEWARDRGYTSYSDYQSSLLEARGLNYTKAHRKFLKRNNFSSEREYKTQLAIKQGYSSLFEKQDEMKERPEKQEIKKMIRSELDRMGRSQAWLAQEVGMTKQGISAYAAAKAFPRNGKLEKIIETLQIQQEHLHESYPAIGCLLSYRGQK